MSSDKYTRAAIRRKMVGQRIREGTKEVFKKHYGKDKLSTGDVKHLIEKDFSYKSARQRTDIYKKMGMNYRDRIAFEKKLFGGEISDYEAKEIAKAVGIREIKAENIQEIKTLAGAKNMSKSKIKKFLTKRKKIIAAKNKFEQQELLAQQEGLQGVGGPEVGYVNQGSVGGSTSAQGNSSGHTDFSGTVKNATGLTGNHGSNASGIGQRPGVGGGMSSGTGGPPIGFRRMG